MRVAVWALLVGGLAVLAPYLLLTTVG